jgi:hypothetical protein
VKLFELLPRTNEVETAGQVEPARIERRAVPAGGDSRDLGSDAVLLEDRGVGTEQMRGESPPHMAEAHERETKPI